MESFLYLYELTIQNYVDDYTEPIFKTIFINFLSKNLGVCYSDSITYNIINILHYHLDLVFYDKVNDDLLEIKSNNTQLKYDMKKNVIHLANLIFKTNKDLQKKNI